MVFIFYCILDFFFSSMKVNITGLIKPCIMCEWIYFYVPLGNMLASRRLRRAQHKRAHVANLKPSCSYPPIALEIHTLSPVCIWNFVLIFQCDFAGNLTSSVVWIFSLFYIILENDILIQFEINQSMILFQNLDGKEKFYWRPAGGWKRCEGSTVAIPKGRRV